MQKARLIAAQWLELRPVALVFERPCRRRLQSAPCLQLQAAYVCLFVYTHHCTIRLLILLVLRSPTHEEETQRWGCHSIPQMLKTISKRVSVRTVSAPYRLLLFVTTDLVVKQYEGIGYGVAISFYANREGYRKCFPTAFSDKHHSIPEFLQSYILEKRPNCYCRIKSNDEREAAIQNFCTRAVAMTLLPEDGNTHLDSGPDSFT
ncbi:hypothetical protein V8C43DRAFT_177883 [Trichoderma afarasin]